MFPSTKQNLKIQRCKLNHLNRKFNNITNKLNKNKNLNNKKVSISIFQFQETGYSKKNL